MVTSMQTATIVASLLIALSVVQYSDACAIWGRMFCDYCQDGEFTDGTDRGVFGATIFANCTIKTPTGPIYYWGTDPDTDTIGAFQAQITGTTDLLGTSNPEASFLKALFINSDFRNGQLPGTSVVGCKVEISNAPTCPIITLNDGNFLSGGQKGNGWTSSNAFIQQFMTTKSADIYIGINGQYARAVSASPAKKGEGAVSCPSDPVLPPGSKGDPHFTGADNSHYDFTGQPGNTYCLVTDHHVHVNAYYGGRFDRWGDNPNKPLTWMRKLGILWGPHTITLAAREGARWQYDNGYMASITVDGTPVVLSQAGDSATFADGAIEISWLAARLASADDEVDVYLVKIDGVMIMRLTLRPEIPLLRTATDGVVHFNIELPQAELSEDTHGVLGQTFRPDHGFRLSKQKLVYDELLHTDVVPGDNADGFLDGVVNDYRTTGLLNADCKVGKFSGDTLRAFDLHKGVQLTSSSAASILGHNNHRQAGVARKIIKLRG